jgi:hypothetical protein
MVCSFKKTPRRRGTKTIRTQQNQAGSGGIQKEAIAADKYNATVHESLIREFSN